MSEGIIHFNDKECSFSLNKIDLPRVFRVGYNKYEGQWLVLLADHPLDRPVQFVGVALVEVEGRNSKMLPHHARHVDIVLSDGGDFLCCSQEFRNQRRSYQIGRAAAVLGRQLL